ncbi:MAG: DNA-3-methyladenine glycosylase 2 family protein, partial [Armatimonadetes bacterium]|nr:DNA-3-methyladenine glycosylase 2 family protein [Armatimonadota bacterium]
PLVARHPKPEFQMSDCVFASLTGAIISQQLSTKAAATIYGRFLKLIRKKKPDAKAVCKLSVEQLRGVGMSRPKASYLLDLSEKTMSGELHIDRLAEMPNDEVVAEITNVKGLGEWSADMFLMFALCRPDVWPVGDLGIQNGVRDLLGREERLPIDELREVAEAWRPYRTVAARYVWDSLDNKPL